MEKKLLYHIIAISFFIVGIIILHVVFNHPLEESFDFFELSLNKWTVIDMGFILIGISFFMEFYLTFNPIKIIKGDN